MPPRSILKARRLRSTGFTFARMFLSFSFDLDLPASGHLLPVVLTGHYFANCTLAIAMMTIKLSHHQIALSCDCPPRGSGQASARDGIQWSVDSSHPARESSSDMLANFRKFTISHYPEDLPLVVHLHPWLIFASQTARDPQLWAPSGAFASSR